MATCGTGTEGLVALAMAQVIVREGLIKDAPEYKVAVGSLEDLLAGENRRINRHRA